MTTVVRLSGPPGSRSRHLGIRKWPSERVAGRSSLLVRGIHQSTDLRRGSLESGTEAARLAT